MRGFIPVAKMRSHYTIVCRNSNLCVLSQDDNSNSLQPKDPFNMSNDEYYNPRLTTDNALSRSFGGTIIQVSVTMILAKSWENLYAKCVKCVKFINI